MRTIRAYADKRGKPWISPVRLLAAIQSGEPITGVNHAAASTSGLLLAVATAWIEIFYLFHGSIWKSLTGFIYGVSMLFFLFYPPLRVFIPSGIFEALIFFVLAAMSVSTYTLFKIGFKRFRLSWTKRNLLIDWRTGPPLDPPLIAHRPVFIPRPSMSWPITLLVVTILLSAFIPATNLRPAIVGGVIHEQSLLVVPGTQWRAVERFPSDIAFSYFFYDGTGLYGVQVSYSVERIDLLGPDLPFRTWVQSYLSTISTNVNNNIATQFPPNISDQGRIDGYKVFWEDPEMVDQLIDALTSGFNSVYTDSYSMRGIEVTVRYISVREYQSIINDE